MLPRHQLMKILITNLAPVGSGGDLRAHLQMLLHHEIARWYGALKATGKLEKDDALLICISSKGVLGKQASGHAHFTRIMEALEMDCHNCVWQIYSPRFITFLHLLSYK